MVSRAHVPFHATVGFILTVAIATASFAQGADEAGAIVRVMRQRWERPDAPLALAPIVVADGFAVAGWIQGVRGGRALLEKEGGAWHVVLCAGDDLLHAATIEEVGVPHDVAARLAKDVQVAEAAMPGERRAMLSLFEGTTRMENPAPHHGGSGASSAP